MFRKILAGLVATVAVVFFYTFFQERQLPVAIADVPPRPTFDRPAQSAVLASASVASSPTGEPPSPMPPMPGQSIVDVSTPSGRQAYYDHLITLSPKEIFREWISASSRNNPDAISQLVAALGFSLRNKADSAIYAEIEARLTNKSGRLPDRLGAADALMLAATPEAIDQLVKFLRASEAWSSSAGVDGAQDGAVISHVLSSITSASRTLIEGGRNWAVANSLQNAWQSLGADASPQVINVLVSAIAYIGKPENIAYLVQSASRLDQNDKRFVAAMSALEGLSSNDSSEVLGAALQQYSYSVAISRSVVRGLISIGSPDAITQITMYVDRSARIDKSWLTEIDDLLARRQLSADAKMVLASWRARK